MANNLLATHAISAVSTPEPEKISAAKQLTRAGLEKVSEFFQYMEPVINCLSECQNAVAVAETIRNVLKLNPINGAISLGYSHLRGYIKGETLDAAASYIITNLYTKEEAQNPEIQVKVLRFVYGFDFVTNMLVGSSRVVSRTVANFKNSCAAIRDGAYLFKVNEPQLAHAGVTTSASSSARDVPNVYYSKSTKDIKSGGKNTGPEVKYTNQNPNKTRGQAEEQLTEAGKSKPVALTDKELKQVVYEWSNHRNKILKKWREEGLTTEFDQQTNRFINKARNSIEEHMKPDDMAAVIKEKRGVEISKICKETGLEKKFNHQQEYRDAYDSLKNAIKHINKQLKEEHDLKGRGLLIEKLKDFSHCLTSYVKIVGRPPKKDAHIGKPE